MYCYFSTWLQNMSACSAGRISQTFIYTAGRINHPIPPFPPYTQHTLRGRSREVEQQDDVDEAGGERHNHDEEYLSYVYYYIV